MSQKTNINPIQKTVLVVGGAGYIGSHTCKQLKKNGFTPIVVDKDISSKPWATQFGPAFEIDLPKGIDLLDEVIKRFEIDSCIHFAAYTKVGESVENPSKYYLNNMVMTMRLLDKLLSHNVKKFVFSSSAAAYGIPKNGVANIDDIPLPINPYGKTKLFVEEILKDYYVAYGLSSVSLRYFNAAGADAESDIGELRNDESHIIPLAIEAAKQNKGFNLFGTDFETEDGTCVRDYVHVTDLADGHVKSLLRVHNSTVCDRFNLGSGVGTSNRMLLKTIERFAGPLTVTEMPRRAGDPPVLIADIDKTINELEWMPKHSTVDNVVKTAVKWYNKIHEKEIN